MSTSLSSQVWPLAATAETIQKLGFVVLFYSSELNWCR